MYLKSLVMKGFKSFADRSAFVLEPGITAIVGPNGSGKSNISDAVLWVLGELNARNLRGQAMEDVIFAGSSSRKPVNVAEVELVLDNSDHTLPVEFEEVSIGRRMYRSGESEYLINGVQARRMDVLEILHDSGLGTGTHSIISQGQLDSVLEAKPEDRRALIEEAAGVLKHKQRKQKSARKLERMDAHLTRVKDITAEVERQIKPLERKAKRAMAYKELSDELSALTLSLAVDDLRTLQQKWGIVVESEAQLRGRLSDLEVQVFQSDSAVRDLQRKLMEHAEGSAKTEGSFHALRNASERVEGTIRVLRERKRSLLRSREEKAMELEADRARLLQMKDELSEAVAVQGQAAKEMEAAEAKQDRLKEESEALKERLSACEAEIRRFEQEQGRLETRIQVLREKQLSMSQAYQEGLADKKLVEDKQAGLALRIQQAAAALEELQGQADASDGDLAAAESAEAAARKAASEAMAGLEASRERLAFAQGEKAAQDARVAALEAAEQARQAGNDARARARKHETEPSDLVSVLGVPEDLDGVVELLLGDAVDALLPSSRSAAESIMEGLQAHQPQGSVYLLEANAPYRLGNSVSGNRLVDLIDCPVQWRGALWGILGDVLVCDTYQQALRICRGNEGAGLRVASRDGFVVSSEGFQRFSRKPDGAVGAVAQRQTLNAARKAAEAAAVSAEESARKVAKAEKSMREAQTVSLDLASRLAVLRGQNESLHMRLDQQGAAAADLRRQQEELQGKLSQARIALEKLQPTRDMVEGELAQCSDDLISVKAQASHRRQEAVPLRQASLAAAEAASDAKVAFATLKERCTYAIRVSSARRQSAEAMEARIRQAEIFLDRSQQAPGAMDELLTMFESLQSSILRGIGRLDAEMQRARGVSQEVSAQVEEARKKSRGLHGQVDALNAELGDVRVEKGRLELQVEAATGVIVKDCGVPLEVALQVAVLEDRLAAEDQADKLRKRIANMGTINPDAAAEYQQLKVRYDFLCGQMEDMVAARRSLTKITAIIDERMKKDFIDTFHLVDANFQEIFTQLFPGGTAKLVLADEGDPEHSGVDVVAQPLGKKVAKTSLMSGGEKSLIAMALLMAVYRTRSTPFYILDEVEAALDDTNLQRLCACLDAMRARSQQLLVITHQRRTMEMADVLYGVSMQGGATKLVSQRLDREKSKKGE